MQQQAEPEMHDSGDKSGLSFVNETTGWATGFTAADNFAWLYITHDGGVTWQHQAIPLPANASQVSTIPPVFFFVSQTQGWAIDSAQVLYQTTDGGQTWTKV